MSKGIAKPLRIEDLFIWNIYCGGTSSLFATNNIYFSFMNINNDFVIAKPSYCLLCSFLGTCPLGRTYQIYLQDFPLVFQLHRPRPLFLYHLFLSDNVISMLPSSLENLTEFDSIFKSILSSRALSTFITFLLHQCQIQWKFSILNVVNY